MHFVQAKSILSAQNGMNLYRGCTHGCIYCDSRSTCYQMNHAFEDIEVKQNAPQLLADALRRKRHLCMIGTGSMCDPYLPLERELRLTRKCLEYIECYGFGATVLTKSDLVLRDLDLFQRIHARAKCVVQMTVTTYEETLCRKIEPYVCTTAARFRALRTLHEHGIPTVVWLGPILPMINDTEENLRGLLTECFNAGVCGILCFGMGVTLRSGDREYFYAALDRDFPGLRARYIRRYGDAFFCGSDRQPELMRLFHTLCAQHGVMHQTDEIFAYLNKFPENDAQLSWF